MIICVFVFCSASLSVVRLVEFIAVELVGLVRAMDVSSARSSL